MSEPRTAERPAGTGRLESNEAGGFDANPTGKVDGTQVEAVTWSRGFGKFDNTPDNCSAETFGEFLDAVLADRGTAKGQQWIAGALAVAPDDALHRGSDTFARAIGQPHRCKACVGPRGWFAGDVDEGLTPEAFHALVAVLHRYSGAVYTTASSTPEAPRCRIVLELDALLPRADLIRASQELRRGIDADMVQADYGPVPWDAACDKPEQPLYLPTQDADVYRLEGEAVAVAELLADLPEPEQRTQPPVPAQGAGDRYALAALDRATRSVETATPGDRNEVLNREAFGLGGFVAAGRLSYDLVAASLITATERAAWDNPAKNTGTVRGGLASGMTKPRADGMPPANDEPAGDLRLVSLSGFMARRVPDHPHVMDSYYPRRVVTLLGGHGGVGKTTLALIHAAHIAAGRPWGPFAVEAGRVVVLSFEDEGEDVLRTLQDVVTVCGLPAELVEQNLRIFDGTDAESELAVESSEGGALRLEFTEMMGKAEEAAAGADIVFIDNASDTFGGNENNRRQVKAFIRRLARRLARAHNAAVVLLAHIDKQAAKGNAHGNSYSGSTAWHNGARSRLALVESEGGIELLHEKARWGRKAETVALQRVAGGILEPVPAQVAAAAKANAQAIVAQADAVEVLAVIRAAVEADLTIPVARTGQRTTWHALCEMPEMPESLRTKRPGKPRVETALTALERRGEIVREEYRTASRHTAVRWTLAQAALNQAA